MKFKLWIRNLLGQFQWYRKRQRGHWEQWRLPNNMGFAWFRVSGCCYSRGYGPDSRLKGAPVQCEQHWPHDCEYADFADIATLPDGMACPVCRQAFEKHEEDPCCRAFSHDPVYRICTGQLVRVKVLPSSRFLSD